MEGDPELVLPKDPGRLARFDYLDLEDIQSQILQFQSDTHARVRFHVGAIHCSSCVLLLEQLPHFYAEILQSRVNFPKKEVDILFKKSLSLSQLVALMAAIGYEPTINLASGETKQKSKSNLGLKIAVAGFCFGNAMLLSLPEYLDTNFLITESFQLTFRLINILLALPVVFFSAQDYFKSAIGGLGKQVFTIDVPIALGIAVLFGRSLFEIAADVGPGYVDSLTGLVFLLLIGRWYQQKTYDALSFDRDYRSYFPLAASKVVEGKEVPTHIKDLIPGDEVVVHHKELIPCDALLESSAASIDYSFVTGESEPIVVNPGDQVFAGGRNHGAKINVRLMRKIDMSYLTSLWEHQAMGETDSYFQNLTDRIAKYFTFAVLGIALIAGVYWFLQDASEIWNVVTSILIVACPCALALALPFSYGHAVRIFGKHGLYVKNANVVELLSSVRSLVFDKTGTLTHQKAQTVEFVGELDDFEKELVISLLKNSSHPLSRMIAATLEIQAPYEIVNYQEHTGKGVSGEIMKKSVKIGSAGFVGSSIAPEQDYSQVFVKIDDDVRGYFRIRHAYRRGLDHFLRSLKEQFRLVLLSGDKVRKDQVLSDHFDELHFGLKPIDKLGYIEKEQTAGRTTAMIGDGLNDAGALKKSDLGIAVADDVHQFSPSCHAILSGDRVVEIASFLALAKRSVVIVKIAFVFSFLYNIVGLSFAVTGHLSPLVSAILMPISSVTVVGLVVLLTLIEERRIFAHVNS